MPKHRRLLTMLLSALVLILVGTYLLAVTPTRDAARTQSIFVYGTLENPVIRMVMCRCRVAATPTTVAGFQREGRNIVPTSDAFVTGSVVRVSTPELAAVDRYEQVPEKYIRTRITDTSNAEHWVYLLRE